MTNATATVAAARNLLATYPNDHKDKFRTEALKIIKDLLAQTESGMTMKTFRIEVALEKLTVGKGVSVREADTLALSELARSRGIGVAFLLKDLRMTFWADAVSLEAAEEIISELLSGAYVSAENGDLHGHFDQIVSMIAAVPVNVPIQD